MSFSSAGQQMTAASPQSLHDFPRKGDYTSPTELYGLIACVFEAHRFAKAHRAEGKLSPVMISEGKVFCAAHPGFAECGAKLWSEGKARVRGDV
jgi:hypothetical protein